MKGFVEILDDGVDKSSLTPYIVMELLNNNLLSTYIESKGFTKIEICDIAI